MQNLENRITALEALHDEKPRLLVVRWMAPAGVDDDAAVSGADVGGQFIPRMTGESVDGLTSRLPLSPGPRMTVAFLRTY